MQVKKMIFMLRKALNDLKSLPREIPIYTGPYEEKLGFYYIVFESEFKKLNRLLHSFDAEGIPLITTYIDVEDEGLHYYPITIGQFALAKWHDFLKGDLDAGTHFMNIADWFVDNVSYRSDELGAVWLTDVPKPEYKVENPWPSAFAQSRAISVLLRAWQHTGKEQYLILAGEALIPFTKDISEGGVSVDRRGNGMAFYEEYVARWPTRVLDGHLFSLFGLFDFMRAAPDNSPKKALASRLFEEGVDGLKAHLSYFDTGQWLRFNKCEMPGYPNEDPCTIAYLKLVIAQIRVLHCMTGQREFESYALKWSAYLKPLGIIKMYFEKIHTLRKLNRL